MPTMNNTYRPDPAHLTAALEKARAAAVAASVDGMEGGTCNLDTPGLFLDMKREVVEDAARAAGVSVVYCGYNRTHKARTYLISRIADGMAENRTRMAEAAVRSLKSSGLDAFVHYAID